MTSLILSQKKLRKISRINDSVELYFKERPDIDTVAARHLMPLFVQQGIFLKDTEHGLPIRMILRDLFTTNRLDLLKSPGVTYEKSNYYFHRK